MKEVLYSKNPMQILSYLSKNSTEDKLYGSKIAEELRINQGSTSVLLKKFEEWGIIQSKNLGKTLIYNINDENPIFKYFRIFENIVELTDLISQIKNNSKKIVLFGSCSTGEDTINSDIDLFIVSEEKELVRERISVYELDREINPVIVTTLELIKMEKEDEVFINEVQKGIELWGGETE